MDNHKREPIEAAELRSRAEEPLRAKTAEARPHRTEAELQRLLHELEVHQIALELQNAELMNAKDEVEAALGKYSDLYDFAPVGYFTLDRDGVIRAANLTGASLLGIERARLIGQSFRLFVTDEARLFLSEFLGKVFASQGKEACEVALKKEGKRPLHAQIEAVAFASAAECRVAVIDITAHREAEDRLQDSEKRYRSLFENMMEGFAYCRMFFDDLGSPVDFAYLAVNSAFERLTGLKNVVGKKVTEVIPGIKESHPELFEIYGRVALTGRPETFELEFNPLGIWLSISVYSPEREYFVAIFSNITERLRAKQEIEILHTDLAVRAAELETANIELEAFNYSVSHDLRRPLTHVNGYCQVLKQLCFDKFDEQCKGYIQEIYEGTLRMNRLIDTLLGFSRVTRVEMRRETIDLSAMAKVVAAEFHLAQPERRVTFRVAEGIMAEGDAGLWRIALDNLIDNAWKFTGDRDDTVIEFGMTELEGTRTCFVRDNGPGFDMAFADKLFMPFQRLAGTSVEGHGIGLATVARIVRRHGGRIWAEGEPGKGATFYFTLSADKFVGC